MQYAVYVENVKQSTLLQNKLFSVGFAWYSGTKIPDFEDKRFLCIDTKDMDITFYIDNATVEKDIKDGVRFIFATTIIEDPYCLEGVDSVPEKMFEIDGKEYSESTIKAALWYSESTIKAALREYVK